jgi:hypothetical protein
MHHNYKGCNPVQKIVHVRYMTTVVIKRCIEFTEIGTAFQKDTGHKKPRKVMNRPGLCFFIVLTLT